MTATGQPPSDLRPRFTDGQVLHADDLAAAQEQLIAVRRRHLAWQHAPGIVAGLRPALQNGVVTVSPGLAVDGYGRELVLAAPTPVPPPLGGGPVGHMGIYLQYARAATTDALSGHARWTETPELRQAPVDAASPPTVDPTALGDQDTAAAWPLLLGVVRHGTGDIDLSGRRYAGAAGAAVSAPQGTSRLALGRDGTVAVTVAGAPSAPALVGNADTTTASGDANVRGALTVGPGAAGATTAARLDLQSGPVPAGASPWSLYRTASGGEELRLELPAPPAGPNPTQKAASVGATDGGGFVRGVSVLTDGTVVINGNLQIDGRLATAPAPVDASDPRLAQALVQNFVRGAQAATETLEELYTGELALDELSVSRSGEEIACSVTVRNTGAVALTAISVTAGAWPVGSAAGTPKHTLARGLQLAPSASQPVTGTVRAPDGGSLTVVVHATGRGLKGTAITAADVTAQVDVETRRNT